MLSEQAREKFILRHREHYGSMVIDEVDVDVNGLLEAQHKADQKEWKREKQEMLKEIDEISFEPCPYQSCYKNLTADECFNGRRMTENCEWWTVLKHKWGIE